MDVGFVAGPVFGEAATGWNSESARSFRAYWLKKLEAFGNVAVAASAARVLVAGKLGAFRFTLDKTLSKLTALSIPFGLAVEKPGLLHLILDVGFYKGTQVYSALTDAYRLAKDWIGTVDRASLEQIIGVAAFELLTAGRTITSILAEVEVPPVWLADP
jgi:hypothetical protein